MRKKNDIKLKTTSASKEECTMYSGIYVQVIKKYSFYFIDCFCLTGLSLALYNRPNGKS